MSQRDDSLYVAHIVEACRRIERFVSGVSWDRFEANEEKQSAVIRQLEIIGEAAGRLSDAFRLDHPDVPWQQVRGLRNVLVHGYADVDLRRVWAVATERVPVLLGILG